jgi:hypothetical protein
MLKEEFIKCFIVSVVNSFNQLSNNKWALSDEGYYELFGQKEDEPTSGLITNNGDIL